MGISLSDTLGDTEFRKELINKINNGVVINFFLCNPDHINDELLIERINITIKEIVNLREHSSGEMKIYLIKTSLLNHIISIDDEHIFVRNNLTWNRMEDHRTQIFSFIKNTNTENMFHVYNRYLTAIVDKKIQYRIDEV